MAFLAAAQTVLAAKQPVQVSEPATAALSAFTPAQTAQILTLGPWPPPWKPDPSNRVSGHPEAIVLGRSLFFDARLSGQGSHSCSSCHRPEMAWQDGKRVGEGLAPSKRNTPSLLDVRNRRWFGWDGAADSLWAQSIRPILDPAEMGASAEHVRAHIVGNAELATAYLVLFNRNAATAAAEDVLVDAAKALAAYQETLVSPRTPFDEFRDALERGDADAASRYSIAAQRGLSLFVWTAGCTRCHAGATLSSDAFLKISLPPAGPGGPAPIPVDLGRAEGIERWSTSPYTLHGRFNDQPAAPPRWSSNMLVKPHNGGAFRVPSLRNVKATAPYLHDGSLATLNQAVAHRYRPMPHKSWHRTLRLDEIADLVAFLETLSPP
jgi:cytochrome c peroxidase